MATIGAVTPTTTSAQSSLGLDDFMKILLTQLTYQDPLKPMDNQQFMAQMAQFTALGQSQEMNAKFDVLLSTQSNLQSVGLIGKPVQFASESGQVLSGTVQGLTLSGSSPTMTISTSSGTVSGVSLSQLVSVGSVLPGA